MRYYAIHKSHSTLELFAVGNRFSQMTIEEMHIEGQDSKQVWGNTDTTVCQNVKTRVASSNYYKVAPSIEPHKPKVHSAADRHVYDTVTFALLLLNEEGRLSIHNAFLSSSDF